MVMAVHVSFNREKRAEGSLEEMREMRFFTVEREFERGESCMSKECTEERHKTENPKYILAASLLCPNWAPCIYSLLRHSLPQQWCPLNAQQLEAFPTKTEGDPTILADLVKWRAQICQDFHDLFQPPTGVPLPEADDFRILSDPTAKIPHRQPYRMTPTEREEFEVQIKKLLANG